MSKIDDGGPAFPVVHAIVPQPGHYTYTPEAQPGMSLRDWFAGQMLAGDIAGDPFTSEVDSRICYGRAKLYYRMADAMLAARKEP